MFLKNLTSLVNSSLKYSNIKDDILLKNNNKVICIKLKNTKTIIFIIISDGTLIFQDSHVEEPDLLIEGSPINLFSYVKNYNKNEDIKIHGDILLAEDITLLAKKLNIDWELFLSEHSTDEVAHYSFGLINIFKDNIKYFKDSFHRNIKEYFNEESNIVPNKYEIEKYIKDSDKLRNKTELLDKKYKTILDTRKI
ncbi:MAG: hypothetical protein CMD90_01685 [Gammaproteobacteria bacterium]|nr:hypothetical protein [Gammaproteobacteria bacterium]